MRFFIHHPRGFSNEYTVGIATTDAAVAYYEARGFEEQDREITISDLTAPDRCPTHKGYPQWLIDVEKNGQPVERLDLLRELLGVEA